MKMQNKCQVNWGRKNIQVAQGLFMSEHTLNTGGSEFRDPVVSVWY